MFALLLVFAVNNDLIGVESPGASNVLIAESILPTSPELRAALDRWREGFEARPSCAECGLVCDCGDCRCEAVKVKPTYTAAPANVECRNGRCYRVSPVQPVRQQASVRYVPQAAPVCRPGMPCYQQQSQPARGRLLPRFFR